MSRLRNERNRWRAVIAVAAMIAATAAGVVAAQSSSAISAGITGYQVVTPGAVAFGSDGPVTQTASVSCPSGQSVVGGGVTSHSPQAFISSSYPSAADTWTITETLPVSLGYDTEFFTPYAVCVDSSSVPGISIAIQGSPTSLTAGTGNISGVQCPSGSEATDGGLLSSSGDIGLTESIVETGEPDIWLIGGYNQSASATETFTSYAVCIPTGDVSDYTAQTQVSGDNNTLLDQPISNSTSLTNTGSGGYCPSGDVAVGGGAVEHDQIGAFVSSLTPAPQGDPHYWLATSTETNPPASYTETAFANDICVNGTVVSQATTTTLSISPTSPGLNHTVVLTATVAPQSGTGTPTGTVTFYDNGNPLGTSPLFGGVATLSVSFGGGSHSLTATYNGDPNFLGSTSAAVTFTIGCTTTITGPHASLALVSGLTCLNGATISGGISVSKGSLDIENSTVTGAISASASAGIRICGSSTGSITVSGATGLVRIGDPASNCAANTVHGSITAAGNKGGLIIVNNTYSGSLTTVGNTGSPITIAGNHH